MQEELNYEYELFLEDMKQGKTFCRYLSEDEYEDEYSHNEIGECQKEFIEKASEHLRQYSPGKYIVTSGWCVFVMTVEEARKRNMFMIEEYIIK